MDIRNILNIISENSAAVKAKQSLTESKVTQNTKIIAEAMGMKVEPLSNFFASKPKSSKFAPKPSPEEESPLEVDEDKKWYSKFLEVADKEEEDADLGEPETPDPTPNSTQSDMPIKPEKLSGITARVSRPGEVERWATMRALSRAFKKDPKLKKQYPEIYAEVMRVTQTKGMPYLHPSLVPLVDKILSTDSSSAGNATEPKDTVPTDSSGKPDFKGIILQGKKVDLVQFYKTMTTRPNNILKQNAKMKHSDGTTSIYYNVGIPAIKGLAGDEAVGPPNVDAPDGGASSFLFINTCPGAGTCQLGCYVGGGGYVQFEASMLGMTQKLNFLYNDPTGFMNKMGNEISQLESTKGKKGTKIVIRWHDAGDFFSQDYVDRAFALAKKHPNVTFYAYTKIKDIALGDTPANFVINYSFGGKNDKSMDSKKIKHSVVVPKEEFSKFVERVTDTDAKPIKGKLPTKLIYKGTEGINGLKQTIAKDYDIDPKTLLTYQEFMNIPPGDEKNKWNVIVKSGDGDTAASRRDVLGSYLLEH